METHYQIDVTAREADMYLALVNLALRGDLSGVQRLIRSPVGASLCRTLREVSSRAAPTVTP
jgi:hypothetical protein